MNVKQNFVTALVELHKNPLVRQAQTQERNLEMRAHREGNVLSAVSV